MAGRRGVGGGGGMRRKGRREMGRGGGGGGVGNGNLKAHSKPGAHGPLGNDTLVTQSSV